MQSFEDIEDDTEIKLYVGKEYCKITNYPDIYKLTYWGKFECQDEEEKIELIFTNRNKFIKQYSITKCITKPNNYIKKHLKFANDKTKDYISSEIDHLEIYESIFEEIYVLVSSTYSDKNENKFIENGWSKYANLYSMDSYTYIKIIDRKK